MKIYKLTDDRGLEVSTEDALFATDKDVQDAFWVDVDQPDEAELGRVLTRLQLHPLVLDNCLSPEASSPIAPYTRCLFVRVPIQRQWDDQEHEFLVLVCTKQVLITVHATEVRALHTLVSEFTEGMKFHAGVVSAVLYQIIDRLVDEGMTFSLTSRRQLETLQAALTDGSDPIVEISRLTQSVAHLEDTQEDLRVSLSNLQTVQTDFFDATDLGMYYRDTLAHLDNTLSSIDRQQSRLAELHQRHLLMLQGGTNRRLRILTILSAVFMPLTLITGIYGMNFRHMPELHWTWAYPAVLVAMLVLAALLLWNFYRKGWFD